MNGYEVVVPVSGAAGGAEATLSSLREHLARPEAVRTLEVEGDAWTGLLAHFGEHPPQGDLLVLLPGVLAAPLLDLRLQWSAYAGERVATVSPLCDLDPATSLARHGIAGLSPAEMDERIAGGWSGPVLDAPYPLPECAFLRQDLAGRLIAAERPRDLPELVRRLRQEGLLFGIAPHVYVGSDGLAPRAAPWMNGPVVSVFLDETPLHRVAHRVAGPEPGGAPAVRRRSRPRLLHVSHSLGGGLERWVDLFQSGSDQVDNFLLRSIGEKGRFGSQLWLSEGGQPWAPLKTWKLTPPIEGTAVSHLGYRQALEEAVAGLGIDGVVVSSLIGHSLDALRSPVPTVVVLHDYYPFCPALHIRFGDVCTGCSEGRLAACLQSNPLNELFDDPAPRPWLVVREAFLDALTAKNVQAVAPSPSVIRHLRQLAPRLDNLEVTILPHGSDARDAWQAPAAPPDPDGPLRVVVLGRVTGIKGEELLRQVIAQAGPGVRFWLVGCGERGRRLAGRQVEVLERYERESLPEILARISPDAGLFLSVVPETFSFTLDECFNARIPPIAVRVGSFADRIVDGVDGFLCDPDAASVTAVLERLAEDRAPLESVREGLHRREVRTAGDMVTDYVRLLGLEPHSPRAYFSEGRPGASPEGGGPWLPAGSPLGFSEFLRQIETGTVHHIRQTRRLEGWKRKVVLTGASAGFRTARLLMRWMLD